MPKPKIMKRFRLCRIQTRNCYIEVDAASEAEALRLCADKDGLPGASSFTKWHVLGVPKELP